MFPLILLALLIVPIVELYVIVQVSGAIGFFETLILLVAISVLGALLLRKEGVGVIRRIEERTRAGEIPSTELVDGALIVIGGALMLTPGFVTDAMGMSLIFPPTRALYRAVALGFVTRRVQVYTGPITRGFGTRGFGTRGSGTSSSGTPTDPFVDVDGPRGDDSFLDVEGWEDDDEPPELSS